MGCQQLIEWTGDRGSYMQVNHPRVGSGSRGRLQGGVMPHIVDFRAILRKHVDIRPHKKYAVLPQSRQEHRCAALRHILERLVGSIPPIRHFHHRVCCLQLLRECPNSTQLCLRSE